MSAIAKFVSCQKAANSRYYHVGESAGNTLLISSLAPPINFQGNSLAQQGI